MKNFLLLVFIIVLIAVLAGCATLEQRLSQAAEDVIDMINEGRANDLAQMTLTPFLLDGEIIILDSDMRDFWATLIEAGFEIGSPVLTETVPAQEDTFRWFADTKEVQSFFEKYATEECHVVIVESESLRFLFLMDRPGGKESKIIGFKGPESL